MKNNQTYDAVVVGAGYGGMATALGLAQKGASVYLAEAMNYPGGCASTFSREGYRFESGATLFSGFEEQQLFGQMIQKMNLPVQFSTEYPAIRFRSPSITMDIPKSRDGLLDQFLAIEGSPKRGLQRFFALQKRVSNALWPVLDKPERLPPFSWSGLAWHLKRSYRYIELLTLMGKPLSAILKRYKLNEFQPLRQWCDAQCQITIQTTSSDAESPYALSSMDYLFRGTGHIAGGIGYLGDALISALKQSGVEVSLSNRVRSVEQNGDTWNVKTRKGQISCQHVVFNATPHAVEKLVGVPVPSLSRSKTDVESGWGAAMLYLVFNDHEDILPHAHHVQVIQDAGEMHSGNHFFCSISPRISQPEESFQYRTATVSTHVPMKTLRSYGPQDQAQYISNIQARLQAGLTAHIPEVSQHTFKVMPASPRTFERFTKRPFGYVGGIPRKAGLRNYRGLFPSPILKNAWMVGDSVFPGQSTLATALGGFRVARAINKRR